MAHISRSGIVNFQARRCKTIHTINYAKEHNDRTKGRLGEKRETHIDVSREHLNQHLISCDKTPMQKILKDITGKDYEEEEAAEVDLHSVTYQDGKKVRMGRSKKDQDAVLAFEVEASYPGSLIACQLEDGVPRPVPDDVELTPEYIKQARESGNPVFDYPADLNEFDQWKMKTLQFCKDLYGNDNLLSAEVHMDEDHPHMHVLVSSVAKDKNNENRLRGTYVRRGQNGILGDIGVSYNRLLDTYYKEVGKELGYERGNTNPHSVEKYNANTRTVRDLLVNMVTPVKLPEEREEAEKAYQALNTKYKNEEAEKNRYKSRATSLSKSATRLDQKRKSLEEEIKRLQKENAEKDQRIKELQSIERRHTCLKQGRSIYEDQKAVAISEQFDQVLENLGKEYFEKIGIDMNIESEVTKNE